MNGRVKVYCNLQGLDLKFEEQDSEILKQPSEVFAIKATDSSRISKHIPLTNKDIYLIIKYDKDINNTVRTMLFKKYKLNSKEFKK